MTDWDFELFDTYSIEHREHNGIVQIRSTPFNFNRWVNINGTRGTELINQATAGDPAQLHVSTMLQLLQAGDYWEFRTRLLNMPNIYAALMDGDVPYAIDTPISKDMTKQQFFKFRRAVNKIMTRGEYNQFINDPVLIIQAIPIQDDIFDNLFDGSINCTVKPILDEHKMTKTAKNKLIKYEQSIRVNGADSNDIVNICKIAKCNISIRDTRYTVWADFILSSKWKKFIMIAHNGHATVSTPITFKYDINPAGVKKEIVFVDQIDLTLPLISIVFMKDTRTPMFASTLDTIYKTRFDQCDQYPEAYSDSGVGKLKFLTQHPHFTHAPTLIPDCLYDANTSGFYARSAPSSLTNFKYDQNQSYRAFNQSKYWTGFPTAITQTYVVDNKLSDILNKVKDLHGLLFVEFPKITLGQPMYYNGSNWYPIGVCLDLYHTEGVDPNIKALAVSDTSFDIDFSTYTKQQFRAFIGSTTSMRRSATITTTSEKEFNHHLYKLGDTVEHQSIPTIHNPFYTIDYTRDGIPWSCFQIGVYVKAFQKLNIYRQINKLDQIPIFVGVDGIELSKPSDCFDIGTEIGQWKIEEIKINNYNKIEVIDHSRTLTISQTAPTLDKKLLPRLLHISGPAGNGKTQRIIEMPDEYGLPMSSVIYLCPENDLVETIKRKSDEINRGGDITVMTYHSYFGINCQSKIRAQHQTFILEECSKITPDHLVHIDKTLRDAFDKNQSFGGKRIILAGDFHQLHPVSVDPLRNEDGDIINNHDTIETMGLYKQFKVWEQKKNYRQDIDKNFYLLCTQLRNRETLSEKDTKKLIKMLNTRVLRSPTDLSGQDSIYIAGTNREVDRVNSLPTSKTRKIINTRRQVLPAGTIPNGAHGTIIGKEVKDGINEYTVEFNGTHYTYKHNYPADAIKKAYAITVHRSQGRTYTGSVVLNPSTLFGKNHLYVAITRCTKFSDLYLTCPITPYILKHC